MEGCDRNFNNIKTIEFSLTIPPDCDSLKIQFNTTCDDVFDTWYIDDIMLYQAPKISFTINPDLFAFKIKRHEYVRGMINFANTGMGNLHINLDFSPEIARSAILPNSKSSLKVAVIGSHNTEYINELTDIVNKLTETGYFEYVSQINAYEERLALDSILKYDAILICPHSQCILNNTTLGDTLADYIDQGGGVVLCMYSFSRNAIKGRFYSEKYFVINPSYGNIVSTESGIEMERIIFPGHPVMDNVKNIRLEPGGNYQKLPLTANSVKIAEWSNGEILAAAKIINGHPRVDLNFYPADSAFRDGSTDAMKLIANSLMWVARNKEPYWISFSNNYYNIGFEQTDSVAVEINPRGLKPDSLYAGSIHIYSNDWDSPDTAFNVSLCLKHESYYFDLFSGKTDTSGYPGTPVSYKIAIVNQGEASDSYQIMASKNNWSVSFWDSAGTQILTGLNNLAPNDTAHFNIKIDIPDKIPFHLIDSLEVIAISQADTSLKDTLLFTTGLWKPESELPWIESFSMPRLNSLKWKVTSGEPYLYHGRFRSRYNILRMDSADAIESRAIFLSGKDAVKLTCYFCPASGDSSNRFYIKANANSHPSHTNWIVLAEHQAQSSGSENFTFFEISIPESLYTNSFQIKFEVDTKPGHFWYLDDIKIFVPPKLSYTTNPVNLNFTPQQNDSVSGNITITNTGGYDFIYEVNVIDKLEAGKSTRQSSRRDQILNALSALKKRWAAQQNLPIVKNYHGKLNASQPEASFSLSPDEVVKYESNSNAATALNVAVLGCEHINDIHEKLEATNTFVSISLINARVMLPRLKELQVFDAILVYSGEHFGFYFPDSLGNVLADFVDAGGGVVIGGAVFCSSENRRLGGRFYSKNYYAIIPGGFSYDSINFDSLGSFLVTHPIMKNVSALNGNYYSWHPTRRNYYPGTKLVANWEKSDKRLVLTKEINGVRRVDLGFMLYSSDADPDNGWVASGDGAQLMTNALLWAAQGKGISGMVTISRENGTLLPQQSHTIDFEFDIEKAIFNKTYKGYFVITGNAVPKADSIGVSLTVRPLSYYYTVKNDSLTKYGLVGGKVHYKFELHNKGSNSDSYNLRIWNNHWPVRILDENLKKTIAGLNNIASDSTRAFYIEVKFETEFESGAWYLDDIEIIDKTLSIEPDHPLSWEAPVLAYELKPNYPNPFNPVTHINYSIPESGRVQVKIYNLLGQHLTTLMDRKQEKGRYKLFWEASAYSAGLYFCIIKVNNFTRTNKLLLLR